MADITPEMAAARAKLAAKMGGSGSIGGKGSIRRKVKAKPSGPATSVADDKKLVANFRKVGINPIPGIDEVNMFTDGGDVMHFKEPKVQASLAANSFVIAGTPEKKTLNDLMPGVLTQLGKDNLGLLKSYFEQIQTQAAAAQGATGDDEIPDLDANFEDVSKVVEDVEVD